MAIQDNVISAISSVGSAFRTYKVLSAAEALEEKREAEASAPKAPKKTEEQIAAEKKEALVNKLVGKEPTGSKASEIIGDSFAASYGKDFNNMLDDADKTTRAGKKSKAANADKTKNKYIEMYEKANKELGDFQESKSLQVKKPRKGGNI